MVVKKPCLNVYASQETIAVDDIIGRNIIAILVRTSSVRLLSQSENYCAGDDDGYFCFGEREMKFA